jgi:hypothetical protein
MATKTTLQLDDGLRMRLKELAARTRKTVTELITEGAELVLSRAEQRADRDELRRRAAGARERLRKGLYSGPAISATVDDLIYSGAASKPRPRKRA